MLKDHLLINTSSAFSKTLSRYCWKITFFSNLYWIWLRSFVNTDVSSFNLRIESIGIAFLNTGSLSSQVALKSCAGTFIPPALLSHTKCRDYSALSITFFFSLLLFIAKLWTCEIFHKTVKCWLPFNILYVINFQVVFVNLIETWNRLHLNSVLSWYHKSNKCAVTFC